MDVSTQLGEKIVVFMSTVDRSTGARIGRPQICAIEQVERPQVRTVLKLCGEQAGVIDQLVSRSEEVGVAGVAPIVDHISEQTLVVESYLAK